MERIRRFFKKLGKKIGAKGYTLLEISAVIAVTATLSAVALPTVMGKLQEGNIAKATGDVQAIRTAILSFLMDTGVPPFSVTAGDVGKSPLLTRVGSDFFATIATKDGNLPTPGTGMGVWPTPVIGIGAVNGGLIANQDIDEQLILNKVLNYPISDALSIWKGPYLPSVSKDPWGNKYLVTTQWLATDNNTSMALRAERAAFVISAGPNGVIDTQFEQVVNVKDITNIDAAGAFVIGGDDIVARIK